MIQRPTYKGAVLKSFAKQKVGLALTTSFRSLESSLHPCTPVLNLLGNDTLNTVEVLRLRHILNFPKYGTQLFQALGELWSSYNGKWFSSTVFDAEGLDG